MHAHLCIKQLVDDVVINYNNFVFLRCILLKIRVKRIRNNLCTKFNILVLLLYYDLYSYQR